MPIALNTVKNWSVKFVRQDQYSQETETIEAGGRSGARDIIYAKYPGCEILDCWEKPKVWSKV